MGAHGKSPMTTAAEVLLWCQLYPQAGCDRQCGTRRGFEKTSDQENSYPAEATGSGNQTDAECESFSRRCNKSVPWKHGESKENIFLK